MASIHNTVLKVSADKPKGDISVLTSDYCPEHKKLSCIIQLL